MCLTLAVPEYDIVQPVQVSKDRHRRYLNSDNTEVDLMLSLSTNDKELVLHLNKRKYSIQSFMTAV